MTKTQTTSHTCEWGACRRPAIYEVTQSFFEGFNGDPARETVSEMCSRHRIATLSEGRQTGVGVRWTLLPKGVAA